MHDHVLRDAEMPQIVPAEPTVRIHDVAEMHDMLVAFADLVVHVIGDQQVDRLPLVALRPQGSQDLAE